MALSFPVLSALLKTAFIRASSLFILRRPFLFASNNQIPSPRSARPWQVSRDGGERGPVRQSRAETSTAPGCCLRANALQRAEMFNKGRQFSPPGNEHGANATDR